MQPHILTIPDDNVYEQLVQLAASAGLHIAANGLVSKPETPKRSREELLAIIRRGGDGLSIPDPLTWQRDDSDLPFYRLNSSVVLYPTKFWAKNGKARPS